MKKTIKNALILAMLLASTMFIGEAKAFGAEPFVKAFENVFEVKVDVKVKFVKELPSGAVGMAYPTQKLIKITTKFWNRSDFNARKALVWHELLHAVFTMKHDGGIEDYSKSDGCPGSIMNEYVPTGSCFSTHRVEYIQQIKQLIEKKWFHNKDVKVTVKKTNNKGLEAELLSEL